MSRWAPICQYDWYQLFPGEYFPESTDFDTCVICGYLDMVTHVNPRDIERAHEGESMDSINLTPSDEGFASIALLFVQNVVGDVKASRQKDAAALLLQAVKITGYLAHKQQGSLMKPVIEYLERASQ